MGSILQQEYERQLNRLNQHRSFPQYEVRGDDTRMELLVEVPGVRASDISVKLEQEGKVLKISGSRSSKMESGGTRSEFEQVFNIDTNTVNVAKLEARLSNGLLTVSVPKIHRQVGERDRTIPVIESESIDSDSVPASEDVDKVNLVRVEDTEKNPSTDDLEITEDDI